MMPLPVKFDANEWFIIISLIITYSMILLLPRQFPATITILIFLLASCTAKVADATFGIRPFDLYDINDTSKFDLFDFFSWWLYPAFGYFLLYAYEKFKLHGIRTAFYVIGCSILSMGFEWMCVKFQVFHYKGWTAWYSLPVYLTVISLYLLFYRLITWSFMLCKLKGED